MSGTDFFFCPACDEPKRGEQTAVIHDNTIHVGTIRFASDNDRAWVCCKCAEKAIELHVTMKQANREAERKRVRR